MDLKCQEHNGTPHVICAQNQWHFVPLCELCLPTHLKSHDHQKLSLPSLEQSTKTITERQKATLHKVKQILSSLEHTEKKEQRIIEQIEQSLFDFKQQLIAKLQAKVDLLMQQVKKHYQRDQSTLKAIEQLRGLQKQLDSPSKHTCTRLYFRELSMPAVQTCPAPNIQLPDLTAIKHSINNSLDDISIKPVELKEPARAGSKEKVKRKEPPRLCKICGTALQYITPFKKSLACPRCNNKELNYQKKKVDQRK